MAHTKAVIFDLGRVLVDFDHLIAARRIAQFSSKTVEEICALFFCSPITGMFEQGKISPADFYLEVRRMIGLSLDYEGFLPIWNEIFFLTEKNRKVYELAKSLRGRYVTVLLSNINVLHYEYLKEHFSVFDAFDHLVLSCEAGAMKPDPAIYRLALQRCGCAKEEVFYTDDRLDLVESALQQGIPSYVFTGYEELEQELKARGIIAQTQKV